MFQVCYIHIKEKVFGGKLIQEMCRLLGIEKTQTSPNKPNGNGQKYRHNTKMADVILKFLSDNSKKWDTTLRYLNFVFNTTINRKTS